MTDLSSPALRVLGPRQSLQGAGNSLSNINTTVLPDGAQCWVTDQEAPYRYVRASTQAVDLPRVVAPEAGGPGRWIREDVVGEVVFESQPNWYVNSVTGSDDNDGATPTTALLTLAELNIRLANAALQQTTNIYLSGDFTTESLVITATIVPGGQLFVRGQYTQAHAGTFTAVTAQNRATNQNLLLTDGALDWTPFIGQVLRLTAGPNAGAMCVIDSNIGAGQARVSGMWLFDPITGDQVALVTPSIGDAYEVVESIPVQRVELNVQRDYDPSFLAIIWVEYLRIIAQPTTVRGDFLSVVWACEFSGAEILLDGVTVDACSFTQIQVLEGDATSVFHTCRFVGVDAFGFQCFHSAAQFFDDTILRTRLQLLDSSFWIDLRRCCFLDCAESCIYMYPGATVSQKVGQIWGSGNQKYTLEMEPSTSFIYITKPTLTGVLGALRMAATNVPWSGAPVEISGCRVAAQTGRLPDAIEGTVTILGAATTAAVALPAGTVLSGTSYVVEFIPNQPTGVPVIGAYFFATAKTTSGFTANTTVAPGGATAHNLTYRIKI